MDSKAYFEKVMQDFNQFRNGLLWLTVFLPIRP